jgi:trk system potassium uptake protein TrkH
MKFFKHPQSAIHWTGIEGAIITLAPLPLVFPFTVATYSVLHFGRLLCALGAVAACIVCASTLSKWPLTGKYFGFIVFITGCLAALPYFATNPFAALTGVVVLIVGVFGFTGPKAQASFKIRNNLVELWLLRAKWAAVAVPFMVIPAAIVATTQPRLIAYLMTISTVVAQGLFGWWAYRQNSKWRILLPVMGIATVIVLNLISRAEEIPFFAVLLSCICFPILRRRAGMAQQRDSIVSVLFNHPARILLTTFLSLCIFGTFLLILPFAVRGEAINLVDAAFTSVSAVCVTGLTVLDTPHDFTWFGQLFILVLIQLGGLGIMTITTVGLHAMGHRFSLEHEHLLMSIADKDRKDLLHSLATIIKFTFITEAAGALLLFILFNSSGDASAQALWKGIFTSVSAFCNAGFALQSDNLIAYARFPAVLHVIALLIIAGGLAPSTCLLLPRWITGKSIPVSDRIAMVSTAVLLFSGMLFFLVFEWEGVLTGLSLGEKMHNAWFQSVTLRTAGFNSVAIAPVGNPTLLLMLFFMFIGGSPGGTAGGIKTTTLGVLAMTFWASITNRNAILVHRRRIPSGTVFRAITITASGFIFWSIAVLMLEVTQRIAARDIIFEATSALGTVGLSTGATQLLDEIGKVIIMITMFAGRVGPMTLFMLLGDDRVKTEVKCPDAKISLT